MMKRILLGGLLLAAILLALWVFRRQPATDPPASSSVATVSNAAESQPQSHNASAAAGDEESVENQRTRPQQRPPDVKHKTPPLHPLAEALPGKPGFVISPFNNKIVDVTGIPPGTLVADPTRPPEEKAYFRVP